MGNFQNQSFGAGSKPLPTSALLAGGNTQTSRGKRKSEQKQIEARFRGILRVADAKIRANDLDSAEMLLDEASKINAEDITLKLLYANLFLHRDRCDAAFVPLLSILEKDPNNADAYNNLGAVMNKLQDYENALQLFEKALDCDPRHAKAAVRMIHNSLQLCNWKAWERMDQVKKLFPMKMASMEPGTFLAITDDPALQKKKARDYVDEFAGTVPQVRPAPRQREEGDKIRLGYFSSDFHRHATMWLMIRMFEMHDRDKFEIVIFDYGLKSDDVTDRLRACSDNYYKCRSMSDVEISALAQSEGIDIAIDLKGYTADSRAGIVFKNPAPVNVSYIGYPGTIGSSDLDYIVADPVLIPDSLRKHYAEKIIYMPDCYQVTDDTRKIADHIPTRAELGLPEDAFVFCSFNAHYKITPVEYDIWMRLLTKVDGSVLWLWCKEDKARENLLIEAEKRGVSRDRIFFADSLPQDEHLARMKAADLFLDTFAVCAHTTASDAMWAGLPLLTLEGKQFAARVASSILQAMEMPEMVTRSMEDYEALALELAQNPEKLAAVRAKIAEKRETAPMFDTERFTRNWERQLERALGRCESGLKPDHLTA